MPTYGTIGKSITKFNVLNNIPILLPIKYDIAIKIYTNIDYNLRYKNE